ncbi:hypothetical protein E4U21_003462 [Claviceps maximensis]|nr:hypothetical protein E4U21_003462 [Claviceps maximensis]
MRADVERRPASGAASASPSPASFVFAANPDSAYYSSDGRSSPVGQSPTTKKTTTTTTTPPSPSPSPPPPSPPPPAPSPPPPAPSPPPPSTAPSPPSPPSSSPPRLFRRATLRLSALRSTRASALSASNRQLALLPMEPVAPLLRSPSIATPAPGPTSSPCSAAASLPMLLDAQHQQHQHQQQQQQQQQHIAAPPLSSSLSSAGPTPVGVDAESPAAPALAADFAQIAISIPTESLLDDDFMTGFEFSKRGSLMFGGKRAAATATATVAATAAGGDDNDNNDDDDKTAPQPQPPSPKDLTSSNTQAANIALPTPTLAVPVAMAAPTPPPPNSSDKPQPAHQLLQPPHPTSPPDIRVLSPDIEKESQKVRSLYETSDAMNWEDGARFSFCEHLEPTPEVPIEEDSHVSAHDAIPGLAFAGPRSASSFSQHGDHGLRREHELAGGLEYWEDVDGADVDRYGFILPPRLPTSRTSTPPDELKSAQYSPRRRHVLQKRDPMGFSSQLGGGRAPSRKVSARSLNTVNSERSAASMRSTRSVIRTASNLLPHNRNRRWMDEAGDMLTVSPNLQDSVEEAQVEKISESLKRKEWERAEKWRKMAKVVSQGEQGEGMEFEFDARNPKLVERTWKGIPDRWRAAAWWSFLATSARETKGSPSVEHIMQSFRQLQERSSPDDTQIDLDVPRTISRHIMFRRRYRGGQRLLFRVLHALSIYYPETGYVQGMASLAATLLCYFDEEKAFVMLVRMWDLRGLERLYRPPDFQGLMNALGEFERAWLSKPVSEKLAELEIHTTAYGTKWYLTLFNLSVPFPAQLRVWDVFLLLGDSFHDSGVQEPPRPSSSAAPPPAGPPPAGPPTGLDILHAASAALIEALREVILDSDFENAMKALTSWIPVKDEDLLMKVTKAEWKMHQGKKKT